MLGHTCGLWALLPLRPTGERKQIEIKIEFVIPPHETTKATTPVALTCSPVPSSAIELTGPASSHLGVLQSGTELLALLLSLGPEQRPLDLAIYDALAVHL